MKLYSAEQFKVAAYRSMEVEGISISDRIDRAANLVFESLDEWEDDKNVPIKVFCGIGNNGAVGLAIARLLLKAEYDVQVYIVNYSTKRSPYFLINYDRIKDVTKQWPTFLTEKDALPKLNEKDLIIDAIFGSGLNRKVDLWLDFLIEHINYSNTIVLSLDVPSGMFLDGPTPKKAPVVNALATITFHAPKLPFYLPDTGPAVGELLVLDIGLDPVFFMAMDPVAILVEKLEASSLYSPRKRFSHKGTFGHALMIGGSYGKMGSICLSSTACMRIGTGMVSSFIPQCGYDVLQTRLPEAMAITGAGVKCIEDIHFDFEPAAICFGPGAGTQKKTAKAFEALLRKSTKPMVIDADGLNLLGARRKLLKLLPERSILTPHPKELRRLMGPWKNDFHKMEKARAFSAKYNVILVLKDAYTILVFQDKIFINSTGNAGMATAGSGDVLAGVITGLLAQAYQPEFAALFGVYLHGKAGDFAAEKFGEEAMIAGDITASLGDAFQDLMPNVSEADARLRGK